MPRNVQQRLFGKLSNRPKRHQKPVLQQSAKALPSGLEFVFGHEPHTYFVSNFPRPAAQAVDDVRTFQCSREFAPSLQGRIKELNPMYILNVAVSDSGEWFMYYLNQQHAYRQAWSRDWPPTSEDSELGLDLSRHHGRLVQLRIGPSEGGQGMIHLSTLERVQLRIGPSEGGQEMIHLSTLERSKVVICGITKYGGFPRENDDGAYVISARPTMGFISLTFGAGGGWIEYYMYGNALNWSKYLPAELDLRLKEAKRKDWTINTAALNPWHYNEYVLVFDQGPIFCCFHSVFLPKFNIVAEEWIESQRESNHDMSLYTGIHHVPSDDLPQTPGAASTLSEVAEANFKVSEGGL